MNKLFNHKVVQLTIGLVAFTFLVKSLPDGNFYEFIWWLQWSVIFLSAAIGTTVVRLGGSEDE